MSRYNVPPAVVWRGSLSRLRAKVSHVGTAGKVSPGPRQPDHERLASPVVGRVYIVGLSRKRKPISLEQYYAEDNHYFNSIGGFSLFC